MARRGRSSMGRSKGSKIPRKKPGWLLTLHTKAT